MSPKSQWLIKTQSSFSDYVAVNDEWAETLFHVISLQGPGRGKPASQTLLINTAKEKL